jgi:hypothetical protein
MKYIVESKNSAHTAWTRIGNYGSENSALSNASRISSRYKFVRVIDNRGNILYSL